MKHFKFIIFLVLISTVYPFLYAQNAKIHGNIIDDGTKSAIILSPAVYSKLIDSKIEASPKNGYFEFNIDVKAPGFYRLYYKDKRISLYLQPRSSVQLSIDNNKKEDFVNFYSDYISENTFLNQKNIPSIGSKEQRERWKSLALLSRGDYNAGIERESKIQSELFEKIAEENNFSEQFTTIFRRNNIEMAELLYKFYYPRFAYSNSDSFILFNPEFLDVYAKLPIDENYEQSVLFYENQMNYLKAKTNLRFKSQILENKMDDLEMYKSYIRDAMSYPNGFLKEYLLENLIGEWISYYGRATDLKEETVQLVNMVQNKDKKDAIKKKVVTLAQYESGKPAPIFSFEDNAGNIRNLKEFIGKIVYIDVWASWCAPCMAEIPHAKALYQKYKDNPDIVFLYISIDEDRQNWEKAMREKSLYDGIQGIAFPNGFNSDFARKYSIQGIPNYILIDKSGNLINHRAVKPSQPDKIYPLFDKLLGIK